MALVPGNIELGVVGGFLAVYLAGWIHNRRENYILPVPDKVLYNCLSVDSTCVYCQLVIARFAFARIFVSFVKYYEDNFANEFLSRSSIRLDLCYNWTL